MITGYTACVDFSAPHGDGPRLRHAFGAPCARLVAHSVSQVGGVLDAVQAQAEAGRWCVGYVRYEAAPAFDPAFAVHPAEGPLAWFAVYDVALPWQAADPADDGTWGLDWDSSLSREAFDATLAQVGQAIAAGDLYQINFTSPLHGRWRGAAAPDSLFAAMRRAQPGGYALYLDAGAEQVLSVSPELFFDWHARQLLTRPMKGTAPRGTTAAEDEALRAALLASPKERAENLMIVDLLRNDVSRIAELFSVKVPRLFRTEALPTVWQMTSDVQARTRPGVSLQEVFAALFPCGSVTGAPKVQAMRMVRALESQPRGIYCGALGVVQPGGRATFNVPIRTVVLSNRQARCGIGSGLVADSTADAEWREWQHKRTFLDRASAPFELLETFGLCAGVAPHKDEHLGRLAAAAAHFGYPLDLATVEERLERLFAQHPTGRWRVRLTLDHAGRPSARALAQPAVEPAPVELKLASRPFRAAASEFVRFKTTRRAHYEAFAPQDGVFDTLLWNDRGEVTEGTRCNVAVKLAGEWCTPAVHCGLLAGIGRAHWLREGRMKEAVIRVEDLAAAQGFAVFNSLRGWVPAHLVPA